MSAGPMFADARNDEIRLVRSVVDAADVGLFVVEGAGGIVLWNRWMADWSGIASERAVGSTLERLFPRLDGGRLSQSIRGACRNGLSAVLSRSLRRAPLPLKNPGAAAGGPVRQAITVCPIKRADGGH